MCKQILFFGVMSHYQLVYSYSRVISSIKFQFPEMEKVGNLFSLGNRALKNPFGLILPNEREEGRKKPSYGASFDFNHVIGCLIICIKDEVQG